MKWKMAVLTAAMLAVCTAPAAAAAESGGSTVTLQAVSDQGQRVILQGADRFEVTWSVPVPRDGMYTLDNQPFVRDEQGNVYVIGSDGVQSYDGAGELRWKKALASHGGSVWSLLFGQDGTLYARQGAEYKLYGATTDQVGYVAAFNKDTGEQRWEYVMSKPLFPDLPMFYTAAGDADGNLVMETRGGIISIGPQGLNWSYTELFPGQSGDIRNNGLTLDAAGNVYALVAPPYVPASNAFSALFCLDTQGKLKWKQDQAAPDILWMKLHATEQGQLYGVNFFDPYEWSEPQHQFVQVAKPGPELLTALKLPHDRQGLPYKGLYKWDEALTAPLWTFPLDDGYTSTTLYTQTDDEGNVYYTDYGGDLISLDPNGRERFRLQAHDANMSDFPFVVTGDGTVYGFSLDMGVFRIGEKGNPVKIFVTGKRLAAPVAPEIVNGNTMVPLRAIFEALHAVVDWNGEQQSITATKGGTTVELRIGRDEAYVNGAKLELEAAPRIASGSTLVPLRFVSEALGAQVQWDGASRVVKIEQASGAD